MTVKLFNESYLAAMGFHSNLCRKVVQHGAPDAAKIIIKAFTGEVADLFPRITLDHRDDGSGGSLVLYQLRKGYRLPRLEPIHHGD